jgi:hypothetical protein
MSNLDARSGDGEKPPSISVKDALSFVIDYGKFLATLWNGFVVFTVGVIGWFLSMHKDGALDASKRNLFIVAYLVACLLFGIALRANQKYFLDLHTMLHKLADNDPNDKGSIAYKATLGQNDPAPMMAVLLWGGLPGAASLAAGIMLFISCQTHN